MSRCSRLCSFPQSRPQGSVDARPGFLYPAHSCILMCPFPQALVHACVAHGLSVSEGILPLHTHCRGHFFSTMRVWNYFFKKNIDFRLHCVFVAARGVSLVAEIGGSPSLQCTGSHCSGFSAHRELMGSLVVVHGLSCPKACGILVSRSGIEPTSLELAGGLSTTGPSRKSWNYFLK